MSSAEIIVQEYNAEHGTDFVYWPGGEKAPEDADLDAKALFRNGIKTVGRCGQYGWEHDNTSHDIIGYRRKDESFTITLAHIDIAEVEDEPEQDAPTDPQSEETLRDKFAMAALTGLLAGRVRTTSWAKDAYEIADEMMEARKP